MSKVRRQLQDAGHQGRVAKKKKYMANKMRRLKCVEEQKYWTEED